MVDIIFIGGARDYHAMDWYRTVRSICYTKNIAFATDLIESEGFKKLVDENDNIIELLNIDRLLLNKQSKYGNVWRNLIKLIVIPVQIKKIKSIAANNPNAIFHALPMYYMLLCWLANIPYIGTPQGSEILVRPTKSKLYGYFASRCLATAKYVTVDSINMKKKIYELSNTEAIVIQNGIDVSAIMSFLKSSQVRKNVTSIRGFAPIYRIHSIFDGRDNASQNPGIHFIYPFEETVYKSAVIKRLKHQDKDLGRLCKLEMYELLTTSKLAISIPESDSSPRSVYEAIFCGCCVAVTYNPWIDALPTCMMERLFIVDITDKYWFDKALKYADSLINTMYIPSEEALQLFDQRRTMQLAANILY